jgi:hypothetical protein
LLGGLLVYPLLGIPKIRSTVRRQTAILERAHRPLAAWIKEHDPPDTLLAVSDCGVIPYEARVRVLDMFGLIDLAIARDGFSTTSVLDRRPDYIVVVSRSAETLDAHFRYEADLVADPRFARGYRQVRTFASPEAYHLFLFERADRHAVRGLD